MAESCVFNDTHYSVINWPPTTKAQLKINAALLHLNHNVKREKLRDVAMGQLIGWRRRRLMELYDAGVDVLANRKKLAFARNCPPCGVQAVPRKLQRCKLRFCPFCYGRRIADIYAELRRTCALLCGGAVPYRIVLIKTECSNKSDNAIFMYAGKTVTRKHNALFVAGPSPIRQLRQLYLGDAYLGYSASLPAPVMYKTEQLDGAIGHWRVIHSVVAVVPVTNTVLPQPPLEAYALESRYMRGLPAMLVTAFCYPHAWMSATPDVVAQMFNDLRRVRFFARFGRMWKTCGGDE
jgi:hypothetical protein